MKKMILTLLFSFSIFFANSQSKPVFQNKTVIPKLRNDFGDYLNRTLSPYLSYHNWDTTSCVDYLNLIVFQIDNKGNVSNISNYINETSHLYRYYKIYSKIDSSELTAINKGVDSIFKSTSGMWQPVIDSNGKASNSKKLLYIISFTYVGKNCREQYFPFEWYDDFEKANFIDGAVLFGLYQEKRYFKQ